MRAVQYCAPIQGGEIETITIDAVVLDSTVSALAGQGTETSLLLATRGDSLDSRAIIGSTRSPIDTADQRRRASR